MDTLKVFTTFDQDENEILIYRENSNTYFDLNTQENVNKNDIDLESLRYLRETVKVLRYMPEQLIKKIYNVDREKTLKTEDLLLGIKGKIENLKEIKKFCGFYIRGIPINDYHYSWDVEDKTYGIYSFIKKIDLENHYTYNLYKNWYDNKFFIDFNENNNISHFPCFGNGMEYIKVANISLKDAIKKSIIEKKKVYEYANKLRKEKID